MNREYFDAFVYEDNSSVQISGYVAEFPDYKYSNNQYVLQDLNSTARFLITAPFYQKFEYNQTISFQGSVQSVLSQDTKWHSYYKKLNVQYGIFNPEITKQDSVSRSLVIDFKTKLFIFKSHIKSLVLERFSSNTSALILGMLFGEKSELSKEEKEMFNTVGISHILVVSGYNIALLISAVFFVLKYFSKTFKILTALSVIFIFVILVGADGSVLRAGLMGSIIIFSKITHRHSNAINVLLLAASFLLLANPFMIFDAGLHLSCIATYALLSLPQIKKIPEFILSTVWVFVCVAPYIIYLSGHLALVSILVNILILFLLPLFMFVSVISLLLVQIQVFLGFDVLLLETIGRYIFFVSQKATLVPRVAFPMSESILFILYGSILSFIIFQKNKYTPIEFMNKHYQRYLPQKPN